MQLSRLGSEPQPSPPADGTPRSTSYWANERKERDPSTEDVPFREQAPHHPPKQETIRPHGRRHQQPVTSTSSGLDGPPAGEHGQAVLLAHDHLVPLQMQKPTPLDEVGP
jgi:hypothetical protein